MNATTALAALRALALLIPVIVELIRALDSVSDDGPAKLATVLAAVETAFGQIVGLGIDWDTFRPLVERIIDPLLKLIRSKT